MAGEKKTGAAVSSMGLVAVPALGQRILSLVDVAKTDPPTCRSQFAYGAGGPADLRISPETGSEFLAQFAGKADLPQNFLRVQESGNREAMRKFVEFVRGNLRKWAEANEALLPDGSFPLGLTFGPRVVGYTIALADEVADAGWDSVGFSEEAEQAYAAELAEIIAFAQDES